MADRTHTDAYDRLGLKAEQLEALAIALGILSSSGRQDLLEVLTGVAEDLAGEVKRLVREGGQTGEWVMPA